VTIILHTAGLTVGVRWCWRKWPNCVLFACC